MSQTSRLLPTRQKFSFGFAIFSILAMVLTAFALFNPVYSPIVNAAPGTTLGAGSTDTILPAQVLDGRTGTDIRFKTNIGNTYHYVNGQTNPAYTLTDTNPAAGASAGAITERANRLMTSRHDIFVYHDGYTLENPDSNVGTISYDLGLFCNSICTSPTDEIEVLKIVNQWDTDQNSATLEETDTLAAGRGIDTSIAGELHISITPFGVCGGTSGPCTPNNTISTANNYGGQTGFVTVVFAIKQNPIVNASNVVIDGASVLNYSAFGAGNGNSMRLYANYLPEADELDPNATITSVIRGQGTNISTNTNTHPVEGDTSYQIVSTGILSVTGAPLNTGTCTTTISATLYTGNVTNGTCTINVPQTVPNTGSLSVPAVTISDGDLIRPITATTNPQTIVRFSLANIGIDGIGNTGTTSEGLTFACANTTSGTPTNCTLTPPTLTNTAIAYIIPSTTNSPISISVAGTSGTTTGTYNPTTQVYTFANVPAPTLTSGQTSTLANVTGTIANVSPADSGIVGQLTVGSNNITQNDLTNLGFSCGTNNFIIIPSTTAYSASAVPVTTCTGTLPTGTQLDPLNPLKLRVGNIGQGNLAAANRLASDTCTAVFPVITCLNVPVGSLTAGQPIFAQLGSAGAFTDSLQKTNVYSQDYYSDGNFGFLKGTTGTTNAYNNILHKDWRTGTAGNEARISLTNLKTYRDILPGTTSSSETNNGTLTNPTYVCNIAVRPAGSTGAFTGLANDANSNGTIDSGETGQDIPYSTQNGCATLFTNSVFTGGQTALSSSNAKTYNWEVQINVKDTALSGNPIVATFNNNVGFKFAAIIPGG